MIYLGKALEVHKVLVWHTRSPHNVMQTTFPPNMLIFAVIMHDLTLALT